MNNKTASICKASSVLFFIATIISGFTIGSSTAIGYSDFNATNAFLIWVAGYITSLFIFACGEIITLLSEILTKQEESALSLEKSAGFGNPHNNSFPLNSHNYWLCPDCSSKNSLESSWCSNCKRAKPATWSPQK